MTMASLLEQHTTAEGMEPVQKTGNSDTELNFPNDTDEVNSIKMNKLLISQEFQQVFRSKMGMKPLFVPPVEQHIFKLSPPQTSIHQISTTIQASPTVIDSSNDTATISIGKRASFVKKNQTPLSKLIEYPGDPAQVTALLADNHTPQIDAAGKDMLGYTALHKFASWDKVDLLELLLPHLTFEDVCEPAGWSRQSSSYLGYSVLHLCVDACAWRALGYLLQNCGDKIRDLRDINGKTFRDMAIDLGRVEHIPQSDAAMIPL
jgi:hypothetical protein